MKLNKKIILLSLGIPFLAIQLVPVDRSNPPVVSDLAAPSPVNEILRTSCYDCHSNETHWPWYSYVAPVSWLVTHDVKEGRHEVNFSEWNLVSDPHHVIEEIHEEVEDGKMPMEIYLLLHPGAALSDGQKKTLDEWSKTH
jgi:hypothetical protein